MSEPLNITGQQITDLCKDLISTKDEASLLSKLQLLCGDYPVHLARISEQWYKLGGVVDRHGNRIALDLSEWVERSFLECGRNFQTLIDHALEQDFIATKHIGHTLYFVVETGPKAENFTLIEIEKTHEVSDRLLMNEQVLPEDLEDIIDPITPAVIESFTVGHSQYHYRRKTDIALFMETLKQHHPEHCALRFLEDWNASSALLSQHFCHHWLVLPYFHTGRYGEQNINAEIINLATTNLPHLEDFIGKQGNNLHALLTRFDRKAGYPFAWYFYMVKGILVSAHNGEAVYKDISGDFAYLPARDEAILRAWIASPYNV